MQIEIVSEIDLVQAYQHLQSPESGGVSLFIGTVRNIAHGKEVIRLEFEAYHPMALAEMHKIAERALQKWNLSGIVMQHVTGTRQVGEAVVAIGAASAHRDAAFEACRFLIDELKKSVPIWKKEFYSEGSTWINAHP